MHHDQLQHGSNRKPFFSLRLSIGLVVFAAIAAFFLFSEHRAHFIGALPFLLVLSCPLMHVFMHRGHGGHAQQPAAEKVSNRS